VITRRSVVLAGGIGLLTAHPLGRAKPAATIRRVGWLSFGSEATVANLDAAFKQGMWELGWLEGKNVEYRIVYAGSDASRLDALARELVGQQVDVILVGNGNQLALRCGPRRRSIDGGPRDAVGSGFVASLAKPGGNITGFTSQQDEVLGKVIGILHEVVPGAKRIAILLNERNPPTPRSGPSPEALAPRWTLLRCVLSRARPRKSAPPSSRLFNNDRRPSW
jgi:putative ABC transport system substrate-binding protein